MGSEAQPPGKTWWEQQRTGLSRLIAVLAFLVVALTESRWELHQEPVAIFFFSIALALAAVEAAGRIWCGNLSVIRHHAVLTEVLGIELRLPPSDSSVCCILMNLLKNRLDIRLPEARAG